MPNNSYHLVRVALVALVVGACADGTAPTQAGRLAPFLEASASLATEVIADEYIVVLKDRGRSDLQGALATARAHGGTILAVYDEVFAGFAVRIDADGLDALRRVPDALFVEANARVQATATQSPTPSWGLDRIDQRLLPLNNSFTYNRDGTGVHVYIIDTGILLSHVDFTGRIGNGFDAITSGGSANDCNGHGTHVAGTAAGTTYGIAKKATLHPVRVLDCGGNGSFAQVIAGMNWVKRNRVQPAVANMSLGGGFHSATNAAADSLVNQGNVALAVASGNSNANACNFSPASAAAPLTVNSTTSTDARSSFSNWGTCTDLFAPGSSIKSDWIGSNTATNTISGTSMATPHVAGALALYRHADATANATTIFSRLLADATTGRVTSPGTGSPNRLLFIGNIGGTPPNNQPPVANFTSSCAARSTGGFRCDLNGSSSTDDKGITTYAWSIPGKAGKTGITTYYIFPSTATYNVTLSVTDTDGVKSSVSKAVVVQ